MGRALRTADRSRHGLVDPGRGATVRGELDARPRSRPRDAPAGEPDGHGQSRSERDRRNRVDGAGGLGRPGRPGGGARRGPLLPPRRRVGPVERLARRRPHRGRGEQRRWSRVLPPAATRPPRASGAVRDAARGRHRRALWGGRRRPRAGRRGAGPAARAGPSGRRRSRDPRGGGDGGRRARAAAPDGAAVGRRRRAREPVSGPRPSIGFATTDDVDDLAELRFALYEEQDGTVAESAEVYRERFTDFAVRALASKDWNAWVARLADL